MDAIEELDRTFLLFLHADKLEDPEDIKLLGPSDKVRLMKLFNNWQKQVERKDASFLGDPTMIDHWRNRIRFFEMALQPKSLEDNDLKDHALKAKVSLTSILKHIAAILVRAAKEGCDLDFDEAMKDGLRERWRRIYSALGDDKSGVLPW